MAMLLHTTYIDRHHQCPFRNLYRGTVHTSPADDAVWKYFILCYKIWHACRRANPTHQPHARGEPLQTMNKSTSLTKLSRQSHMGSLHAWTRQCWLYQALECSGTLGKTTAGATLCTSPQMSVTMVSKVLVATLEINLGRHEGSWVTDYTKELLLTGRFLPQQEKNVAVLYNGEQARKWQSGAGALQPTGVKGHGNYVQWDALNMTKDFLCAPAHRSSTLSIFTWKKYVRLSCTCQCVRKRRAAKKSKKPHPYTQCRRKASLATFKATVREFNVAASLGNAEKGFLQLMAAGIQLAWMPHNDPKV